MSTQTIRTTTRRIPFLRAAVAAASAAVAMLAALAPGYAQEAVPTATPAPAPTQTADTTGRDFARFEVHQKTKRDIAGTLRVTFGGDQQSAPVSARANSALDAWVMFPERTGHYRLEVVGTEGQEPLLWADGEITKIRNGEYQHRLISSDANADVFVLTPTEEGIGIDLGSVKGYIEVQVNFTEPATGDLQVGLDANNDGVIADTERASVKVQGRTSASLATSKDSFLPLTSRYEAKFLVNGVTIARNEGLYDFLDLGTKGAQGTLVREMTMVYARTPIATRIAIQNASIHRPPENVRVEPRREEKNSETFRPDAAAPTPTAAPAPASTTPTPMAAPVEPPKPEVKLPGLAEMVSRYWGVLAVVGAVMFAAFLLYRIWATPGSRRA